MTSRERVRAALNHQEPDRVPLNLGGTRMSAIHAESHARLRAALSVDEGPIRIFDLYQMICEIDLPVVEALEVDVLPLHPLCAAFGLRSDEFKRYRSWWTPESVAVQVPSGFTPSSALDGGLTLLDAEPGRSGSPAHMPERGWYFDRLKFAGFSEVLELEDVATFRDERLRLTDDELDHARVQAAALDRETDKALAGGFYLGRLSGPAALSFADWMIAHLTESAYVGDILGACAEVAVENLSRVPPSCG